MSFFVVLAVFVTYTTSRSVRRVQRPLANSPEELNAYVRRYYRQLVQREMDRPAQQAA
jgi:hypothetical protein